MWDGTRELKPEMEWGENEVKAYSDAVGLMGPHDLIYMKTDVGLNQSCV